MRVVEKEGSRLTITEKDKQKSPRGSEQTSDVRKIKKRRDEFLSTKVI